MEEFPSTYTTLGESRYVYRQILRFQEVSTLSRSGGGTRTSICLTCSSTDQGEKTVVMHKQANYKWYITATHFVHESLGFDLHNFMSRP